MANTIEAADLLQHVTTARWFGGKGRRTAVGSVTPLPWLSDPAQDSPAVRLEVVEIGYPEDPAAVTEWYQLAVSYRPRTDSDQPPRGLIGPAVVGDVEMVAHDALQDPAALRLLLTALLAERQATGSHGSVAFHLSSRPEDSEADSPRRLSGDLEPQIFTGQQSNTSVMFGDVAMVKFFRRLELGRNLDIEVHDALNAAGISDVAALFGWVDGEWTVAGQTRRADLAMVAEKLADADDGWGLALESVGSDADFAADAYALGAALAQTHRALRESFPTDTQAGADVATLMSRRLGRAVAAAPVLDPYAAGLQQSFAALTPRRLDTQRVHGDFHLGQTLRTPAGWKIIDFEGEPAKTLAERQAPDSIWRDIAGMLRSFDYAAASVTGPVGGDGVAGAQWAARSRTAFLDGYATGAGQRADPADSALLRAYEADKAVYEVVYEARNRPDWVGIPLTAVAGLAAGHDLTHHQTKE